MIFKAELKQVQANKKGLDIIYKVVLETEDKNVLALGTQPADTLFDIDIEVEGDNL